MYKVESEFLHLISISASSRTVFLGMFLNCLGTFYSPVKCASKYVPHRILVAFDTGPSPMAGNIIYKNILLDLLSASFQGSDEESFISFTCCFPWLIIGITVVIILWVCMLCLSVLRVLHGSSHSNGRFCYYPHFTDQKVEAQGT